MKKNIIFDELNDNIILLSLEESTKVKGGGFIFGPNPKDPDGAIDDSDGTTDQNDHDLRYVNDLYILPVF